MKKISIHANILELKEIFENLKASKGFPKSPEIDVEVELDDIPQNYEYLCKSPLVKSWRFVKEPNPEKSMNKVSVESPNPKFTKENSEAIKKQLNRYNVNLKDLRDVIKLAYSFYCTSKMNAFPPYVEDVFKYYKVNQEKIQEKVYSEEIIMDTINALSVTRDPVSDFLERIGNILTDNYTTFDGYYKALYSPKK